MLNLRNAIVSVALVAVSLLAIVLVSVTTGINSEAANQSANPAVEDQRSPDRIYVKPADTYRSLQGECFDVPLRELAGCRAASQATVTPYRSPVDECYDVPLRELANCRKASQSTVP